MVYTSYPTSGADCKQQFYVLGAAAMVVIKVPCAGVSPSSGAVALNPPPQLALFSYIRLAAFVCAAAVAITLRPRWIGG